MLNTGLIILKLNNAGKVWTKQSILTTTELCNNVSATQKSKEKIKIQLRSLLIK